MRARTIACRFKSYIMDGYATVSYVTTPNEEDARKLARKIIENRLAACVNITKNVESIYEWDGKVITDKESLLIIKSNSSKTKDLIEFVERNHSYDCPEVITIRIDDGSKKYMEWIGESIKKVPISTGSSKEVLKS